MSENSNGGGYGNPGAEAQSQYQAHAQAAEASAPNQSPQSRTQHDSPSSQMAQDFSADEQLSSQPSPVQDAAVDGTGIGLHNQSEAFRSQTQIAYQDGSGFAAEASAEEE